MLNNEKNYRCSGKGEEMDKKQITLRIPDEIHEALKKEAEREGISVNNLVLRALWKMKCQSSKDISP